MGKRLNRSFFMIEQETNFAIFVSAFSELLGLVNEKLPVKISSTVKAPSKGSLKPLINKAYRDLWLNFCRECYF